MLPIFNQSPTRNNSVDSSLLSDMQRIKSPSLSRGQTQLAGKKLAWQLEVSELVKGHYFYTLSRKCLSSSRKEELELIVKSIPGNAESCYLGIDPKKQALAILFDGIDQALPCSIVRMCMDNQQSEKAYYHVDPGTSIALCCLDELKFSNYLVRVKMEKFGQQSFMLQVIR